MDDGIYIRKIRKLANPSRPHQSHESQSRVISWRILPVLALVQPPPEPLVAPDHDPARGADLGEPGRESSHEGPAAFLLRNVGDHGERLGRRRRSVCFRAGCVERLSSRLDDVERVRERRCDLRNQSCQPFSFDKTDTEGERLTMPLPAPLTNAIPNSSQTP